MNDLPEKIKKDIKLQKNREMARNNRLKLVFILILILKEKNNNISHNPFLIIV